MLEGKNAIVTGASKGIGLEIVKRLCGKGVNVAGWSRSSPDYQQDNFVPIMADVGNPDSVATAWEKTKTSLGENVHFLINNAGYGVFGPFETTSLADWQGMFNTNVHGIFYVSRLVVPAMKALDFGHIVNISSIVGKNPLKNGVGYAATKHAVTGLSHSLFMEVRDYGIKVSCVYPGSVQTNFFDDVAEMETSNNMMQPSDVAKSVVELLETSPNYFPVDIEMRPLRPKGKPVK